MIERTAPHPSPSPTGTDDLAEALARFGRLTPSDIAEVIKNIPPREPMIDAEEMATLRGRLRVLSGPA